MSAIPLADYARLGRAHRRTRAIRAVLAMLLVGLVCGAVVAAARPSTKTLSFLPSGSTGIVVLDLSASISTDTFQRIGTTLRELASTNGRYGLVVFSDVAYQALPPGTPSAELKPYARFFTLPPTRNGFLPQFPVNPWTNSFSGGTRIAAGLGLAFRIIQLHHIKQPAVVLVSDLDDDPGDLKSLAGVSLAYRQAGIPVRIVALDPQPKDQALFGRLLERAATVQQGRLPGERAQTVGADAPPWLSTLVALIALALGVNELWASRLTWGHA
jgi:hypothetical protein